MRKVTNYAVRSFEDVVIFVHDVEKCIAKLDSEQQLLIRRIGVQQYSQADVAGMQGQTIRTVIRRYNEALDRLTRIFILAKLMEPQNSCQGAEARKSL